MHGHRFHKVLFTFLSFVMVFASSSNTARADYWGATALALEMKQMMEQIQYQIQGAILGAVKQQAAQIMQTQITSLIGGGNNTGPLFIDNWSQFLVNDPQKKTVAYMNDFFRTTTNGRGSSSTYQMPSPLNVASNGDFNRLAWLSHEGVVAGTSTQFSTTPTGNTQYCSGDKCSSNYYTYEVNAAKDYIDSEPCKVDLMDYASSPEEVFDKGNWRGFNAFFENPCNNSFGYSLVANEEYQKRLAEEEKIAESQSIAYQGYKAVTDDSGIVKTPGVTIGDVVNAAQEINFNNISSAGNASEIFATIGSGLLEGVVPQLINEGVGQITNKVNEALPGVADTVWNRS